MTLKPIKLSLPTARKIVLNCQLLDGSANLPTGKEGIAQTIEKLGYIQIDTIAVIERAHHHTLWTRCPDYAPDMLHHLQTKDRRIFEYWGHQASYLPMSDFRYYLPKMQSFHKPDHYWFKERHEKAKHLLAPVLQRIREEGPLSSKDFKPPPGTQRGTWWDWKPAKIALEFLYWRGDLMITERRNFQKVYDLTERVLPPNIGTTLPTEAELGQFFVKRALQALGVARERDICEYIDAASRDVISKALRDMLLAGEVQPVQLENDVKLNYYTLPEIFEHTVNQNSVESNIHILSPFDNLIIHRDRTKRLFNFDYTIECYLPAEKRKYGYFSLPILWQSQLVGRLDPAADRKRKILQIRNLIFEPDFRLTDAFVNAFRQKMKALAQFNHCEEIVTDNVRPAKMEIVVEKSMN
jgi:uncharacterized protein YcaQ